MTSTNLYQGYDQGRPTSKVMAPPGGASSNIFGVEPYPVKQQKTPDINNETTSNRLFGGDAPEPSPVKQPVASDTSAPAGVNTHAGHSRNHASYEKEEESGSPIITQCRKRFFKNEGRDGEEEETEEERKKREEEEEKKKKALEQASSPARAKPPRGAYNPITGEDYPDKIINWKKPVAEKPAQAAQAPRVRQPPGGKSSGPLW